MSRPLMGAVDESASMAPAVVAAPTTAVFMIIDKVLSPAEVGRDWIHRDCVATETFRHRQGVLAFATTDVEYDVTMVDSERADNIEDHRARSGRQRSVEHLNGRVVIPVAVHLFDGDRLRPCLSHRAKATEPVLTVRNDFASSWLEGFDRPAISTVDVATTPWNRGDDPSLEGFEDRS